jgi:hypothetical protein
MTDQDKLKFLEEHLHYEHEMFEYSLSKLYCTGDQLGWNSFYESFAIHARNLYDFFRNDGGGNNFKARDFANDYSPPSANTKFNILDPSVFHLGKQRTGEVQKLTMQALVNLAKWISTQHDHWYQKLDEKFKAKVRREIGKTQYILLDGVTVNTACSSPSFSTLKIEAKRGSLDDLNFKK